MNDPPFPKPIYFSRERRWKLSELLNYERKLSGIAPEPFDPAKEQFLTAAQVKKRYGDVSDMWLWRRVPK